MNNYCLVFDDHPLVCVAIKSLVQSLDIMKDVLIASTTSDAIDILKTKEIDLLVLDVNLKDCDGYEFLKRIRASGYSGKVIFFSAETNHLYSMLAFKSGADGYVSKSENHDILKDAIYAVVKGYSFFKFKHDVKPPAEYPKLSSRESRIMKLLVQGMNNRDIAALLSISDKTVSTYKRRILDKFSVGNLVELLKIVG